eukprot:g27109.t1
MSRLNLLLSLTKRAPAPIAAAGAYEVVKGVSNVALLQDYLHMVRCVERFRLVLASEERKLFVMLNLNKQLWLEQDLLTLFEELRKHTTNFLFLVVDCSWKNLGESSDPQLLNEIEDPESHARLVMYRLPCAGDNTGSYFRNEADAQGVKSLLLEPFRFDLAIDPLDQSQTELPDATQGYTRRRRWGAKKQQA